MRDPVMSLIQAILASMRVNNLHFGRYESQERDYHTVSILTLIPAEMAGMRDIHRSIVHCNTVLLLLFSIIKVIPNPYIEAEIKQLPNFRDGKIPTPL